MRKKPQAMLRVKAIREESSDLTANARKAGAK